MKRRHTLLGGAATLLPGVAGATVPPDPTRRVLRLSMSGVESSLDPTQITGNSREITAHIFEALYTYDHLARPARLVPLVADGLPEHNDDFTVWTFRVRRGIRFADDPAFGGRPRELVARDFVYAISRFADPQLRAPAWSFFEAWRILGLSEARAEALRRKRGLDHDQPIEGLRLLDSHRFEVRLGTPSPRFDQNMAASDLMGAVAREVVEHYGDDIGEHPVGTGPFMLTQWRRSSLLVLDRNPHHRERAWDARPAADDAEGLQVAARLRGRRVPLVDRVEVALIAEEQPRWASFVQGGQDLIAGLPSAYLSVAMPGGKVAPYLERQGVRGVQSLQPGMWLTMFNMQDPVVGGYDAAHVALRRAIALAINVPLEIRVARQGMAIPAQSPVVPGTTGYDPAFRSEMGQYSPARARALLELAGYVDRDGDGWREGLDGKPLVLTVSSRGDADARLRNELWQRDLTAIGLRVRFHVQAHAENQKAARAGRLQIWDFYTSSASADGAPMLSYYDGTQVGGINSSRFDWPAMNRAYQRLNELPDGPEREAVFLQAKKIAVSYMPYKVRWHGVTVDLVRERLVGYRRPDFWTEWWHMVDIENSVKR